MLKKIETTDKWQLVPKNRKIVQRKESEVMKFISMCDTSQDDDDEVDQFKNSDEERNIVNITNCMSWYCNSN